jgi:hypothetical protein
MPGAGTEFRMPRLEGKGTRSSCFAKLGPQARGYSAALSVFELDSLPARDVDHATTAAESQRTNCKVGLEIAY